MSYRDPMTVTVPEGTHGDAQVRRFTVDRTDSMLTFLQGKGMRTGCPEGTYTGLYRRGTLWMSDTPDEKRDHAEVFYQARNRNARRALVNGLGLGMVVAALLTLDSIEHVDVVECDADVIALAGPHYQQLAARLGKTVQIHHGDAYTISWPKGTRWNVAWHDIWLHLCTDNLAGMATLHRRYGRRADWQGSWGHGILLQVRRKERAQERVWEFFRHT